MDKLNPDTIRNTARAVITRKQSILLQRKDSRTRGEHYCLPGGAQKSGETLEQAVRRECLEEIACEVTLGTLLHVGDYFKQRYTPEPHIQHQLEFLFRCTVPETYVPRNGPLPDSDQLDISWVPFTQLASLTLSPAVQVFLDALQDSGTPIYLGTLDVL